MATLLPHQPHQHRRRIAIGLALAVGATWLVPTFAASSNTWDRLAQCESGQRWDANTGNGYYGGLQFSAGTWLAYGGAQFADKAHRATRQEQITVAERLLADRGWGPWPACSTKLKLTAADAVGNPFPALPTPSPTDPTAPPTTSAPPTADAATVLAAAERKATNTAARALRKQAEADAAKLKWERAVRNARTAPPEQWAARAPKVTRLQAAATTAAEAAAKAQADADRAARKLRAAKAAVGVTG